MSPGLDLVDVDMGTVPLSTGDLAKIDAAASARGATREAVVRSILRAGVRALPEAPR